MADSGASLYNRHRPTGFSDLVGQGHVARALTNALEGGSPPRAYLFSGPRGTGKTTIARILARCLTCQSSDGPTAQPCMTCDACLKCGRPDWLDVVEVDAASSARRIDEMRDWLESVRYPPIASRYRVTIMDEAHQIQKDAASALLKTLEEPPPHLVVILCTTHPWEIIGTIRSRLQHYVLRRPSVVELLEVLRRVSDAEGIPISDEALDLVARAADGSYRDGLGLLEMLAAFGEGEIAADDVVSLLGGVPRETVSSLVDAIAAGDAAAAFALLEGALDGGADPDQLIRALVSHLRHVCLVQQGAETREEWGLTDQEIAQVRNQAERLDDALVIRALDLIADAQIRIRHGGADSRLQLELVAAKLGRPSLPHSTEPAAPVPPVEASPPAPPPPPPAPEVPPAPETAPTPPAPAPEAAPAPETAMEDPGPEWEHDEAPARSDVSATAPAPAAPSAVADVDPEAAWPQVLAELRDVAPPLASMLAGSRLEAGESGEVTVIVPSEVRRTMLERSEDAGRIGLALARHTGGEVRVRYAVGEGETEVAPEAPEPSRPLGDDELHDRLKSMFNATPENPNDAQGGS
jgi:DNA polymerase-3 subunit gamma/tau